MNYIARSLETVVGQVTEEYPVVLVTGSKQVGKTTMLRKMMEHTSRGYVSLDDLNERSIAKNDPELFCRFINRRSLLMRYSMHRSCLRILKFMLMNITLPVLSG